MQNLKQTSFILLLILSNVTQTMAQDTSDRYWDTYKIAANHYENAEYPEAAAAFEIAWTKPNKEEIANHRLHAAAANCMIDNEEKVKENLFKIVPVSSWRDMKRILVNYEIFNKYKDRLWWTDLKSQLDSRLQNLIDHHKQLKIFKKGRNIKYSAIRINAKGDTVANTFITMIPDGTGWGHEAASSQSQVVFKYDYTIQDSLDHILELDTISHRKFWEGRDTTGVIEREHEVWMHPFRNNEFFKTEIAPFPCVKLPISDTIMRDYHPKTVIMANWGSYTNTTTEEFYTYKGEVTKSYASLPNLNCHRFDSVGINTRHGESTLEYFFNEEYGFVEMNYKTYDGDVIQFEMVEVME